MLMGWGPFRFTVPNYSVEQLDHRIAGRVDTAKVIGARPTLHLLGPDDETQTFESTFFPFHLNGKGLEQLEGVRQAVLMQASLLLVSRAGKNYGRWVATSLDVTKTSFMPNSGIPQEVTARMEMIFDGGGMGGIGNGQINAGNFGINASLSFGGMSFEIGF